MAKKTMKRYLSICLAVVMMLTTILPVGAYAVDDTAMDDTTVDYEAAAAPEPTGDPADAGEQTGRNEQSMEPGAEEGGNVPAAAAVADYAAFLSALKVLEGYAQSYAAENAGEDAQALLINYIRTGVEQYTSDAWVNLCGQENTAFTAYVSAQDAANGTAASALKELACFDLPNNNYADMGRVFAAMDAASYAKAQEMTAAEAQAHADRGGWAGDIADLMFCAVNADIVEKVDLAETDVDVLAANIRARYLGASVNTLNGVDHAFTDAELCGDLDAFYLTTEMTRGDKALSEIIEAYFTAELTEADRAAYFLANRLDGVTAKDDIRGEVLRAYTDNALIGGLESAYALADLPNCETLRKACCCAFADYLFELAGESDTAPVDAEPAPDAEPAAADDLADKGADAGEHYFNTISKRKYAVAPGAVESNLVLNDATGQNQNKAYVMEVDMSNPGITVVPSYRNMDPTSYGTQIMSEQAAAAVKKGYNVVGAINVNLSWDSLEPLGMLVIDGHVYHESNEGGGYLVVYKDNTAELRPGSQPLDGSEWQAITANFGWLVKDGKSQFSDQTHTSPSRAPRTCIGIKADGSIVLLVVDGRQDPVSVGMSMSELAETLIDLGCVDAVNCDGGGSSTFLSQREGGDLTVKNVPSDGTERATLGGLLVVSNSVSDGVFDHASVTADADYYTPKSEISFHAVGVDKAGGPAELPTEGLTWKLADDAMGSISQEGVFTSNGTVGEVTAQLLYQGEVCGVCTVSILEPDSLFFFETSRSLGFDVSVDMSMLMQSQGRTLVYKGSDFTWDVELLSANDPSVTDPAKIGWIEPGTTTLVTNHNLSGDLKVTAKYTRQDGKVLETTAVVAVGKLPSVFWDYEDGMQMVEVWEEVTETDEATGETTTFWKIKTDADGNIVYETKYLTAEEYYSSLMVKNPGNVTVEEQRASHFGLRSDRGAKGHTEIVDINSGEPVRFGDKSLKMCYDFTQATGSPAVLGYGYMQNTNYAPGSPSALGMWIYVPEGTPGYSLKSIIQSAGKAIYLTYGYTYTDENGEEVTVTSLDEMAGRGWVYVTASLVGKGDGTFKMLRNYTIRLIAEGFVAHPDRYAAGCIYVDNIEFIYGYDNKDTANPIVTSVYDYNTDAELAKDGTTVLTNNTVSFASTFTDDDGEYATGMDLNSVRVYIDGVNMVDHLGFVVTPDNLMVLPNVHLANGLHSLRVRIRDKYGNETNETRYFTVNGSESCDTTMTLQPVEQVPYLGAAYTLALTAENSANIQTAALSARFDTVFGAPEVTFAEGFTGTHTYSAGTGELTLHVTRESDGAAADGQLAWLTFRIPETLTAGASFAYGVTSGSFTTVAESSFTNSFSFPTVNVPVQAHYLLQAEDAVAGYPFYVTVTDEAGAPAANVSVHVDGQAEDAVTGDDGRAAITLSEAGTVTAYAYRTQDGNTLRSWNQRVIVHTLVGDGTAAPWFIQNNASASGKSITWLSHIAAAKDAAVLRLYTEDPAQNADVAYTEHTGRTELVHFAAESARVCTVELAGLTQGATYYYTVGDGETWSDVLQFTMGADPGKTNFFIIGDTQTTDTTNVEKILRALGSDGKAYDFAIQTGDAVDDSSRYAYWNALSNVFNAQMMNGVDMIHVLGNHEFYGDVDAKIPQTMYNLPASGNGSYYSVEYGNVYVAVINYSTTGQYQEAFDWLVKDAQASTCRWKVLTMHVPAYGTNAEARNAFVHDNLPEAAQKAGLDFVFSGHDHSYARTKPMTDGVVDENGVVYFICGSTGEKGYHVTVDPTYNFDCVEANYDAVYLTVEATDDSMTIMAKGANGELLDSYTKKFTACEDGRHAYRCDLEHGTAICARCGDKPTGIIQVNGKLYYAMDGKLYTGWRSSLENADLYYFSPADYAAVTGKVTVDGKQFVFNDECVLVRGAFVQEGQGTRYYFGKRFLASKWIILDEGTYWVDGEGYLVYGNFPHQEYNHADCYWYHFDEETGLLTGKCSGFVTYQGATYWCGENGEVYYGAVKVKNGIIFTGTIGKVFKNTSCYVDGNTVGCQLERGKYWCDANGYILKDGFADIDGSTYYFTDYIHTKGFTKIGNDYYIFNAGNGKMYKDATMWVGANNYGVEPGMHYFDADGKMFVPDLEHGVKKITEENGKLYFTVDGVKMKNGLYELDGEYYFAQYSGELAVNESAYAETTLLSGNGWYGFGADGKLIKTGFISGGDGNYYYTNGVRAKGFTKIGDDYYLFNAGSGKMYKDATMWVPANDYGVEPGMHYFDADGKMFVPDLEHGVKQITEENGKLYFTIDGVKMTNGLYELDGAYYFARYDGTLVTNGSAYVETTELSGNGWYGFGADGKLIKTGFISGGDGNYYYTNGVRAKGFTKIGDDYYLFNAGSGKMYKDATMWVPANDYGVEPGMHYFDADGKMFVPDLEHGVKQITEENGKLYFTIDGVKMTNGLYELDGAYYFARYDGTLVTNGSAYVETNLFSGKGWYGFDADGRLIKTGFVTGDGKSFYYADGVRAKGFTKIENSYYIFNAHSGMMYKDANMWVGANNYGVEPGMHHFNDDGKMAV